MNWLSCGSGRVALRQAEASRPAGSVTAAVAVLLLATTLSRDALAQGLPAVAGVDLSCPEGIPGLGQEFFAELAHFQRTYCRDSVDRSRGYFSSVWSRKIAPVLVEAFDRCPAAVTNILVNCILAIDFDYGTELAKLYWFEALALVKRYQENLMQPQLFFGEGDAARTYPLLLGLLKNDRKPCLALEDDEAPRIYVYETPLTIRPVHCGLGQWGTEVLFHKFFERSSCRTTDPMEADLFFVPVYGTCYKHFYLEAGIKDAETSEPLAEPGNSYFDRLMDFLLSSPFWERRGGMDRSIGCHRLLSTFNMVRRLLR